MTGAIKDALLLSISFFRTLCDERSNGLVVKSLDSQPRGPMFKTTG